MLIFAAIALNSVACRVAVFGFATDHPRLWLRADATSGFVKVSKNLFSFLFPLDSACCKHAVFRFAPDQGYSDREQHDKKTVLSVISFSFS